MKAIKFLTILFALGLSITFAPKIEARDFSSKSFRKDFKTWKITESRNGGFAGMMKSYTLDNAGNLTHRDRTKESSAQVSENDVREISRLLSQLKLPSSKMKTAKGRRIYDGVYSLLTITLDNKEYKIDGSFFSDTKIVALTSKQQRTLEKLKVKLKSVGAEI